MSSVAYPFILSLSNNLRLLSSYIYLSQTTIPRSKTTILHANRRISSRTANQTQKTKLASICKKDVHQDRRTLRGLPVHLYHSRRRSMLSRWSTWSHYHIKRSFGRIYMPATLGYRCEALLIVYIPAFFSWLRLRQRRIHSTTPRGIPPLTSQDKAGGGFGGAKIRLLLRRKPRLRKDWGMPIGYGRMLDGYVIELGGHWQAHGQGSLGRGLLHLKLDRNHWWIFSWLFHWKHHPSAMARLAELRSQPLPLHIITLLTSTYQPPKTPLSRTRRHNKRRHD